MSKLPEGYRVHEELGPRCPHCAEPVNDPNYRLSGPNGLDLPLINGKMRTRRAAEKFALEVLRSRGAAA